MINRLWIVEDWKVHALLDSMLWRTRAYATAPHAWWDLDSGAGEAWL